MDEFVVYPPGHFRGTLDDMWKEYVGHIGWDLSSKECEFIVASHPDKTVPVRINLRAMTPTEEAHWEQDIAESMDASLRQDEEAVNNLLINHTEKEL